MFDFVDTPSSNSSNPAGYAANPCRIPRCDSASKSCWTPDGTSPVESVLMVAPTDSPVFTSDAVDGVGSQCSECGGYYLDSSGQPVYSVDYVRYWDCCGASAPSVEHKVEQALELVKSHLMFAVREEMRSLKDELDELVRQNERLELENRLLRSRTSAEVLKRLGLDS